MEKNINSWFTDLYNDHGDAIFRHCYFRISNRERAKELSQEVFIKAWQYIADGKEVENMKAFLYQVANNIIIDEWRKKKSLSLDQLQESGFDPGKDERQVIIGQVDGNTLLMYLEKMGPPCRDLIVMRFIDDLGPKEIAELRSEKQNAVSVAINRCLKKIRALIQAQK